MSRARSVLPQVNDTHAEGPHCEGSTRRHDVINPLHLWEKVAS
jgi:hypothetical protein